MGQSTTVDHSSQVKKLQANLKKAEVAFKATKGPKVFTMKAFGETIIVRDEVIARANSIYREGVGHLDVAKRKSGLGQF